MQNNKKMIQDHGNLSKEQNEVLGFIHSINKSIEGRIFDFENSKYKDYEKLSYEIVQLTNRKRDYQEQAEGMNIPIENIKAFNNGIVKGLINPSRLSYTAYYE